jgi:hypothetical protein
MKYKANRKLGQLLNPYCPKLLIYIFVYYNLRKIYCVFIKYAYIELIPSVKYKN